MTTDKSPTDHTTTDGQPRGGTPVTTDDIVNTFEGFFAEREHRRNPGSSLVTRPGDPVLYTTSGMHPLTPYLEGRPHPLGRRLVGLQRCLRTTDLDEVGDRTHLTVFGMLGSWSLGDYGGEQSLRWGYELLRDGFGIGADRLHATVFSGDDQVPLDQDSLRTWEELGVRVELTSGDNWWSNGPTGPCGPDSEIFVWTGDTPPEGSPTSDDRWLELWNHVMMRYRRLDDGSLEPLAQHNIDTGLGLERLVMVLQDKRSVYETDLFQPWMRTLPGLWRPDEQSLRLLTDHLRSSIVVIGDEVRPSNTGRGYVLRRLIRRALTTLWRDDPASTIADLPDELLDHTLDHFRPGDGPIGGPRPAQQVREIRGVLLDEEARFRRLLDRGRRLLSDGRFLRTLTPDDFAYLHDTHGLPPELVLTILTEVEQAARTEPA